MYQVGLNLLKVKRIFVAIEVLLQGRYMVKINGKIQMDNVRRGD